jgi:hypothetical protein
MMIKLWKMMQVMFKVNGREGILTGKEKKRK